MDTLRRFLAAGNRTGKGSGLFRIGPLKLLGDGSLGSRTAHLSRPYLGADGQYGFNLFSDAQMREQKKTFFAIYQECSQKKIYDFYRKLCYN